MPNPARMAEAFPILLKNILPVFVKKDARTLEQLLWEVYRHGSNYKLQGIALWAGVAAIEMALAENSWARRRAARSPILRWHEAPRHRRLLRERQSRQPARGGNRLPAKTRRRLRRARVNFRLGGRMSRNADSLPGRTETLIPLVRRTFGDDFALYADANSSYDVPNAIRIGRLMEEHRYGFYEEPCPFDWLWETKEVADALTIPIAGGEQEFSLRNWQWMIEHRGVDIVQPDLHYGGGYLAPPRSPAWPRRPV